METALREEYTALYTDLDIEYNDEMSGPYTDLSTYTPDCEVICAIQNMEITGFWRPVVAFGDPQKCLDKIKRLWTASPHITFMDYCVGGMVSPATKFLMERGYDVKPVYVQVIDLAMPEAMLRQGVRKSYHSLINDHKDTWRCSVDDVRAIHLKYRGVTRFDRTWEIQKRMNTVCFAKGETSAVMFYAGPCWAYYACAAGENGHACIWQCLLDLKQRGVRYVEMGERIFHLPEEAKDREKILGISNYKGGFGGSIRMRLLVTEKGVERA